MRKFTKSVVAALVSAAMLAQGEMRASAMPQNKWRADLAGMVRHHDAAQAAFPLTHGHIAADKLRKIRQAEGTSAVITEAPAGRDVFYSLKSGGLYPENNNVYIDNVSGIVGEVRFCDDNTVYIKDPFSKHGTGSYIKGVLDGATGVVTIHTPQLVEDIYEPFLDLTVKNSAVKMVYDPQSGYYVVDESDLDIRFVLRNDSLIWADAPDRGAIIGLVNDLTDEWLGYGDFGQVYSPVTDEVMLMPAGAAAEDWVFTANGDGHNVKVAFDGNDVYVAGVCDGLPQACIKGTVSGDRIVFGSGQYLGPLSGRNRYHTYFMAASAERVYDELYGVYYYYYKSDDIEFSYDAARQRMRADSSVVLNGGNGDMYIIEAYDAPLIKKYEPVTGAVKPQTPEILLYSGFGEEEENCGYIGFNLSRVDVDGNLLDADRLHYNIYVDDEILTLYSDEYRFVDGEMTDIPLYYDDRYDIFGSGMTRTFYFYTTGFDKIGVQITYTAENGDKAKSDIGWYDVAASAIGSHAKASADVRSVRYADLSGRSVSGKEKGIYIKTVTYTDGTVRSMKVVRK